MLKLKLIRFPHRLSAAAMVLLASSSHSHAILGHLLPESELPDYVCSLMASKWVETETKVVKNPQNGQEEILTERRVQENSFYCSAVLVASDRLYTAAHCHPHEIAKMVNTNPNDPRESIRRSIEGFVTVACGKKPTPENTRILKTEDFNKNPFFSMIPEMKLSNAVVAFDLGTWKMKSPITSITPVRVEKNFEQLIQIAQYNQKTQRCRSFGFGQTEARDENGKVIRDEHDRFAVTSGKLNGAITPITAMTTRVILSDLEGDGKGKKVAGGRTSYSDSGGALVCETASGKDVLVGIISRGKRDFAQDTNVVTDISRYSMPSFHSDWLNVVEKGEFNSSSDEISYMISETKKVQNLAREAIKKYKDPVSKELIEKRKILKATSKRDANQYAGAQAAVQRYEQYVQGILMAEEIYPNLSHDFESSIPNMDRASILNFYDKFYDLFQGVERAGRNML